MGDYLTDCDKEAFLLNLIESRKWNDFIAAIQSDSNLAFQLMSNNGVLEGEPLLHECCKHQPPVSVIKALLVANFSALRRRGKNGLTPLHYAVSNDASAEVVKMLILSHPFVTRMRDEIDNALPLHLAAETGASQDVLLEILTAHPEGIYIRDNKGKTPMDHAEDLIDPSDRRDVIDTLNNGTLLCKVSKAAQIRIAQEHENKIRSIHEIHLQATKQWEERYLQIQDESKRSEQNLKKQLAKEKASCMTALKQVTEKEALLEELSTKYEELEVKFDEELDKYKRLEREKMNFQFNLNSEADNSRNLQNHLQGKDREISDLEERLENVKQEKVSLEEELESQKDVLQMLVEEVEQIPNLEFEIESKTKEIGELVYETKTDKEAIDALGKKVKAMEENIENLQKENYELREYRESNLVYRDEVEKKLKSTRLLGNIYKTRTENLHNCLRAIAMEAECWKVEDVWSQKSTDRKNHDEELLSRGVSSSDIGDDTSHSSAHIIEAYSGEFSYGSKGDVVDSKTDNERTGNVEQLLNNNCDKGERVELDSYEEKGGETNNKLHLLPRRETERDKYSSFHHENEIIVEEVAFEHANLSSALADSSLFKKVKKESIEQEGIDSSILSDADNCQKGGQIVEEKREEKETVNVLAFEEDEGSEAMRQTDSPA